MRFNRGTIILLGISVIVIVAVLLLNSNQAAAPDVSLTPTAGAAVPLFASVTQDSVTRYDIKHNVSGDYTVVSKDEGGVWQVTQATYSTTRQTDQIKVTDPLAKLVGLSASSFATQAKLSDFGLESPAYTIAFNTTDGQRYTLSVGAKSPSSRYYGLLSSGPSPEATPDMEATVEASADAAGGTIYLLPLDVIDGLTALVGQPPYVPAPTATPTPLSALDMTLTAAVQEATATAAVPLTATAESFLQTMQALSEATAEATGESTTEATMEATPDATAAP